MPGTKQVTEALASFRQPKFLWPIKLRYLRNEALRISSGEVGQHYDGQPIMRIDKKCGPGATYPCHWPMRSCLQHRPQRP